MKRALPLIASLSLAVGACGAETTNFLSFEEVIEDIDASDDMTNSRAYGIGVGIVTACVTSAESSQAQVILPEGFEAVNLQNVVVDEYNSGLAQGLALVESNDPNMCEFQDASWNE